MEEYYIYGLLPAYFSLSRVRLLTPSNVYRACPRWRIYTPDEFENLLLTQGDPSSSYHVFRFTICGGLLTAHKYIRRPYEFDKVS